MANDVALYNGSMVLQGTYDTPELALAAASNGDIIQVGETDSPYLGQALDINGMNNITIEPKPGEFPIISNAIAALASVPNALWTLYGTVAGREVYYATYTDNPSSTTACYASDGMRLWTYGSWTEFASFHAQEGIYLDAAANRLYIWLYEDQDPNGVALWISNEDWVVRFYNSNNCIVQDLTLQVGGYSVVQIRYDAYENSILSNTIRYGHRGILANPYSGHNDNYGNIIDGNTVYDTYRRRYWSWDDVKSHTWDPRMMENNGISYATGGADVVISNNIVHGWFDGISLGFSSSGTPYQDGLLCYGNTIYDCRDDAINIEWYHRNAQIYDNLIYDTLVTLAGTPHPQGPTYVYRNRFIADRISLDESPDVYQCSIGTKLSEYDGLYACDNINIYHNTFWSLRGCIVTGTSTPPLNLLWYNNIAYSSRQSYSFDNYVASVSASSDDAEETGAGVVTITSSDLDFCTYKIGMRFLNVTVPQGSTLVRATLRLTASANEAAGGHTRLFGELVADASTFTTGANDISNRPTTTAFKYVQFDAWTLDYTYDYDCTDIVQEIIDQGTWSSGNNLVIMALNNAGIEHSAYSQNGTGNAPRLTIEYLRTPGGGSGYGVDKSGFFADGNDFDYNLYYCAGAGTKFRDIDSAVNSFTSLALAQAAKPAFEPNGIESDPLFDTGSYPYPLTIDNTSPAYENGRVLPGGWPDSAVIYGTPDIGYYEYDPTPPTVITVVVTVTITVMTP